MYIWVLWCTALFSIGTGLFLAFTLPAQLVLVGAFIVLISTVCFMFKN
ncbi:MAG: hypothetical protein IJP19_03760 [Clostridia bacterium]|nr:hypothetical protein [Clostridia bacterium]